MGVLCPEDPMVVTKPTRGPKVRITTKKPQPKKKKKREAPVVEDNVFLRSVEKANEAKQQKWIPASEP